MDENGRHSQPPSGRRATISVNVPPRSIQNCQRMEAGAIESAMTARFMVGVPAGKRFGMDRHKFILNVRFPEIPVVSS